MARDPIPWIDLRAQHRSIQGEVEAAISEVLAEASFALGPAVAGFEERFARYVGTRHAIGVNSGSSALHLALLAAGVGPGDEVVAPAMTFIATAAAIEWTGARPVLVDVDPATYTMDTSAIASAIGPRTRALVPVHLYGQPAAIGAILEIAEAHDLVVVEDAAQAHGAEYRGRRCGSIGHIAAFSFYPAKNLGACGEGGAVTTNRDDLAERVRALRDWGQRAKGLHELRGFNYRMDGIQGAVLCVKLGHLERWIEARRSLAARYDEQLAGVAGVTTPGRSDDARHVFHVYAVRVGDRDGVRSRLQEAGVGTGVHYPTPIHLHPCLEDLGYRRGDFPVAERLADEELSLPLFPELEEEALAFVCESLVAAVEAGG